MCYKLIKLAQRVMDHTYPLLWAFFFCFSGHGGLEQPWIGTKVLGHSLVHSVIRSHHSLVCLPLTAHFARTLCCAYLFARSLTPKLVGKCYILCPIFQLFSTIVLRHLRYLHGGVIFDIPYWSCSEPSCWGPRAICVWVL